MPVEEDAPFTVFLTGKISDRQRAELQGIAPQASFRHFEDQAELDAHIADAHVVTGHVGAEALARAGRLEWVHSWAAGPNRQLFPEMRASPVRLTSSKGNGAIPLAEHAMMLMIMLNRNAMHWIEAQRAKRWEPVVHPELNGMTCAVLGTGHAGQDLALKAKAFHMRTIGLRRTSAAAENFDRIYAREELGEFLAEADFLVVTAPLTPETRDMLGDDQFAQMKPSAYYIAISRGGVANDDALLKALREGTIAGAGLDAQGVEPLPEDSPFWDLNNVIITPHNGATTAATRERGYAIFRDNLKRYVAGEPLTNLVDKEAGY